jgi:hypothetical protein
LSCSWEDDDATNGPGATGTQVGPERDEDQSEQLPKPDDDYPTEARVSRPETRAKTAVDQSI